MVSGLANHSGNAMQEEEKSGRKEHGTDEHDQPDGPVATSVDDVERGQTDENARSEERQAEQGRGAAVDRRDALGRIVGQCGREAGAAAQHLLEPRRGIGGVSNDDRHGAHLKEECRWQVRGAIGLRENPTLYGRTGEQKLFQTRPGSEFEFTHSGV